VSLPDGSNIQVYRNQAAVVQSAAVLNTTSGAAVSGGPASSDTATNVQKMARAIAASPAHRRGQTNPSRRITW
jgi:hypothetical protein